MVEIIFFSDSKCEGLYPLNLDRCISTLQYGGRSISTQWNDVFNLSENKRIKLNSRLIPCNDSINTIKELRTEEQWIHNGILIAEVEGLSEASEAQIDTKPVLLNSPAELFEKCAQGIQNDIDRIQTSWRTRTLHEDERDAWAQSGVFIHGPLDRIHVAPGAKIRSCSLNTEEGDIVLGVDSELMEGCSVRGPFVLGSHSQLKMGSLIYGPTSIGAHCRIGGEINNSVFHDYSNKAHGGFIGNSVIGSWCNLGAETTSSNLKNNYSEVSVWDNETKSLAKSGRTFHGLIMGDHSKTAIHTSFNTGTVVGAFCNVFGAGTPDKHIPSFTWGGAGTTETHDIEKAIETASKVMKRRGAELSSEEEVNIRQMHKSRTFGI